MRFRALVGGVLLAVVLPVSATGGPPPEPDGTPPVIDVTVTGPTGRDGWFIGDAEVSWSVEDPETPVTIDEGCEPLVVSTDTPGTEFVCTATSDGGTASESITVKRDATAPRAAAATPSRGADRAGWYSAPVDVRWTGSDAESGVASCSETTYGGPDTPGGLLAGTCRDRAGNVSGALNFSLRYDATAPTVTGVTTSRPIPASGWFAAPVDLVWAGTDVTSGVASCSALRFGGLGTLTGTCTDRAGNVAAPLTTQLRYDAQPPGLNDVAAARLGASGARVTWDADGADGLRVTRRPGRDGARSSVVYTGDASGVTDRTAQRTRAYTYEVVATDVAGNAITASAEIKRAAFLLAPEHGALVGAPPELRWRRVGRARFYNVQLFRGDDKILTKFPARTRLKLQREWEYRGERDELEPGVYRWYVWASYGPRSKPRYGRMLGGRGFVVQTR